MGLIVLLAISYGDSALHRIEGGYYSRSRWVETFWQLARPVQVASIVWLCALPGQVAAAYWRQRRR